MIPNAVAVGADDTVSGLPTLCAAARAVDGVPPLQHVPDAIAAGTPFADALRFVGGDVDDPSAFAAVWPSPTPADPGRHELTVVVHPDHRRLGWGAALLETALAAAHSDDGAGTSSVGWWTTSAGTATDHLADATGAVVARRLFKLHVPLPLPRAVATVAEPAGVRWETWRPEIAEDLVAVNNAAFADHPDQGTWTVERLSQLVDTDWFDPDGLLVARDADGGCAGFCWTRLHRTQGPDGHDEGEIHVIGVHPDHAGRGLGRALVVHGLGHLAASTHNGMLYCEETNLAARRLYRSLGFRLERVDTLYDCRY